jgi:hypothetical protein
MAEGLKSLPAFQQTVPLYEKEPDDSVVCIFMEVKAYEADCWCNAIMGR